MLAIRPVRLPADEQHIIALDRAFTTNRIYQLVREANSFQLVEVEARPPLHRDFPLDEAELTNREGIVAELGEQIVGYAAYTHQQWNLRTELWHLYVAPQARGSGIGRALISAVAAAAKDVGTRCIWLETSNLAWPAIQFYRRLGFELCGLDQSLYDPAGPSGNEVALYFMLPLENRQGG